MNSSAGKEKWQEIIDAWRASGLGKSEFCKKQKIVRSAFYYWHRKLDGVGQRKPLKAKSQPKPKRKSETKDKSISEKKVAADNRPAFVEISIPKSDTTSQTGGQVFRITTSYGAVMEIPI